MGLADYGAHGVLFVKTISYPHLFGRGNKFFNKGIGAVTHGCQDGTGQAPLARTAEK